MLEIIIFLVIIFFVIGILKTIWDALKEIILGILGIGIIIAAVIFLGPFVLACIPFVLACIPFVLACIPFVLACIPFVLACIPFVLACIPWILAIFLALAVLGCIITLLERWKYRLKLKELNRRGIDKIIAFDTWQKPAELGLVDTTLTGYVVSTAFCRKVMNKIGRTPILTRDSFQQYCAKCAKQFQAIYVGPLLEFLQKKNLLFPFSLSTGEICYLSKPFVTDFKNLFLKEGAATEDEFIQVCANADIAHNLRQENQRLAIYILNHMLSCGEIQKVDLSELGGSLYVAKNQSIDSKMTRREISLD